mmetsp:Transcript_9301/g.39473  ORF Transcript_9301/g.39473 Transcript_9301/m.39473 type:complete len:238 (+) Transcript_9301:2306-3019(+)
MGWSRSRRLASRITSAASAKGNEVTWQSSKAVVAARCLRSIPSERNSSPCLCRRRLKSTWNIALVPGVTSRAPWSTDCSARRATCPRYTRCTNITACSITANSSGRSRAIKCSRCFSAMSASEGSRCSPSMNRMTLTEPARRGDFFLESFLPSLPAVARSAFESEAEEASEPCTDSITARAYATTVSRMIKRHTVCRICLCVSGNSATTPKSASLFRHKTTAWHSVTAGGDASRSFA